MKARACLRLKDELRLGFEMLRIQASDEFPSVVVVFEKTADGTRREQLGRLNSRCREVDFLKNRLGQTVRPFQSIAHAGYKPYRATSL